MEEEINQNRPEKVRPPPKGEPAAEHSFDELAKGLANRSLSRGDALKWAGRALAGGLLAAIPGIAWAQSSPQDPLGKGGAGGPEQASPQDPLGKGGAGGPEQATSSPQPASKPTGGGKGGGGGGCPTGQTKCPARIGCVDLSSDPANCGGCG